MKRFLLIFCKVTLWFSLFGLESLLLASGGIPAFLLFLFFPFVISLMYYIFLIIEEYLQKRKSNKK